MMIAGHTKTVANLLQLGFFLPIQIGSKTNVKAATSRFGSARLWHNFNLLRGLHKVRNNYERT